MCNCPSERSPAQTGSSSMPPYRQGSESDGRGGRSSYKVLRCWEWTSPRSKSSGRCLLPEGWSAAQSHLRWLSDWKERAARHLGLALRLAHCLGHTFHAKVVVKATLNRLCEREFSREGCLAIPLTLPAYAPVA